MNQPLPVDTRNVGKGSPKTPWTVEEDQKILKLMAELGPRQFGKIAEVMPGRSSSAVCTRWCNYLMHQCTTSGLNSATDIKHTPAAKKMQKAPIFRPQEPLEPSPVKSPSATEYAQPRSPFSNHQEPQAQHFKAAAAKLATNVWTKEEDKTLINERKQLGDRFGLMVSSFSHRTPDMLSERCCCVSLHALQLNSLDIPPFRLLPAFSCLMCYSCIAKIWCFLSLKYQKHFKTSIA
jgi:hypothetical protein